MRSTKQLVLNISILRLWNKVVLDPASHRLKKADLDVTVWKDCKVILSAIMRGGWNGKSLLLCWFLRSPTLDLCPQPFNLWHLSCFPAFPAPPCSITGIQPCQRVEMWLPDAPQIYFRTIRHPRVNNRFSDKYAIICTAYIVSERGHLRPENRSLCLCSLLCLKNRSLGYDITVRHREPSAFLAGVAGCGGGGEEDSGGGVTLCTLMHKRLTLFYFFHLMPQALFMLIKTISLKLFLPLVCKTWV